jgi:prepilin-type N-terminal cleavage/methylation domain-containing protein
MMHQSKQHGFTLIELLVVIAIIVILAAILYPVFQSVREKARQAQCQGQLAQIATALREYRQEWGRYPFAPFYSAAAGRYLGGVSALYPDYIPSKEILICPDDLQIRNSKASAQGVVYSSYNGWELDPKTGNWGVYESVDGTNPDGLSAVTGGKRTYNYLGFCQEGWDVFAYHATVPRPFANTLPSWLRNEGLKWRHYPRLYNRTAPDNTIITHCVHHRRFFKKDMAMMDAVLRLSGKTKMMNVSQVSKAGTTEDNPSKWVSQRD